MKPDLPRLSVRGGELLLVLGSDIVDAFASPRIPRLCELSGVGERMQEWEWEFGTMVDGDGVSKLAIPM